MRVPISLGVLLDVSDSMFGRRIKDAREAVERFLFEMLQPEDENVAMGSIHRPKVLNSWTSTPEIVRRALENVPSRPAAPPSTTPSSPRCR